MRKTLLVTTGIALSLLSQAQTQARQQVVQGIVSTADDNDPAIGATVVVKGNREVGVATDLDGHFSLSIPAGNKTLIVSYIGYKTVEVPIKPELSIILEVETKKKKKKKN